MSGTNTTFIKNYKFSSRFPEWGECDVVFTSVAGHLTECDFDVRWKKWKQCAPVALFEEARIIETIPQVFPLFERCLMIRDRRGFMIILSRRVYMLEDCLFGQIVIGRVSILDMKLSGPPKKAMRIFKSNVLDSIILKERTII